MTDLLDKAGSGSVEPEDFNAVVDAIESGPSGKVTAADIDSLAAQDGDVLTADGAGNATWEAGGGSQAAWEAVTVPTDETSWSAIDPAGNWDFTDGVIVFTNAGIGSVPVILTTADHFGQSWAVEAEVSVADATQAFGGAFNAGSYLYNADSAQELDGFGLMFYNQSGGATVQILNNLAGNAPLAIAEFAAPDSNFHRIRVLNLPTIQLAYYDDVLVGQNNSDARSANINPADGTKESRFLIWESNSGNPISWRNLKAWRIPMPSFPA